MNNEKTLKNAVILVVDDESVNRLLLSTMLKKREYLVIEAKDGEEAEELLTGQTPDLILLDVMMPGISGFEVCERLKKNTETAPIPVILVTALNHREDIEKGIKAGADEFISKPVDINELMTRVQSLLKIKEMNEFIERTGMITGTVEQAALGIDINHHLFTSEIQKVLDSILDVNIQRLPEDRGKPEGLFLEFFCRECKSPGKFYYRKNGKIESAAASLTLEMKDLEHLGVCREGALMSNWQSNAPSVEEYWAMLPRELLNIAGEVHNFLFIHNGSQKALMVNFRREIKPYDISWYYHLIRYLHMVLILFGKMAEKEEEYIALTNSLGKITEIKDNSAGKHERIHKICTVLCRCMECSPRFTAGLLDAIQLFDIGKLLLDQTILLKTKPLSESEWEIIREAPEFAERVFEDLPRLSTARDIAANLYERWDGSGYPHGKKGNEIPLAARIVSIANVYDSLRITKSYRPAFSHGEAVKILTIGDERLKPEYFDPDILAQFIEHQGEINAIYSQDDQGSSGEEFL